MQSRQHGSEQTSASPVRGGSSMPSPVLGHGRLADIDPKFEKLPMDPRGSPERILQAHPTKELTDLCRRLRSTAA